MNDRITSEASQQPRSKLTYPDGGSEWPQGPLKPAFVGEGHPGRTWRTKQEIALHFQIGVRTVTKLMSRRILPYSKLRNLVRFDVAECERAFEFFKTCTMGKHGETETQRKMAAGDAQLKRWSTKRQIADHIRLSERTVTTLMRQRELPYVKLGHLVRFDMAECDRVIEATKTRSILERRFKSCADQPKADYQYLGQVWPEEARTPTR